MKIASLATLSCIALGLLLPGAPVDARQHETRDRRPPVVKDHPGKEHGRWSTKERWKFEKRWKVVHREHKKLKRKWRCRGKCSRREEA